MVRYYAKRRCNKYKIIRLTAFLILCAWEKTTATITCFALDLVHSSIANSHLHTHPKKVKPFVKLSFLFGKTHSGSVKFVMQKKCRPPS